MTAATQLWNSTDLGVIILRRIALGPTLKFLINFERRAFLLLTFANKQAGFCTKRVNPITLLPFSGARKDGSASLTLREKGPGAEQAQKQGRVGGMGKGGAGEDMKEMPNTEDEVLKQSNTSDISLFQSSCGTASFSTVDYPLDSSTQSCLR